MRSLLPLAALALLSACEASADAPRGETNEAATVATTDKEGLALSVSADGKTASVNIADAAGRATEKAAIDLSPIAAPLPGAQAGAPVRTTEGGTSKVKTTYTTSQTPAQVASIYDARIKAAGASPMVSASAGDNIARVVVSNGGRTAVAIGITRENGATRATVETSTKG
jgi:hypothetical protein